MKIKVPPSIVLFNSCDMHHFIIISSHSVWLAIAGSCFATDEVLRPPFSKKVRREAKRKDLGSMKLSFFLSLFVFLPRPNLIGNSQPLRLTPRESAYGHRHALAEQEISCRQAVRIINF